MLGGEGRMLGEVEEEESQSSAHGKKLIWLNLIRLPGVRARPNNLLAYIYHKPGETTTSVTPD